MEIEVKLPELGDGIKAGDVLEVLVNVGDEIKKDQGILEVETDKATVTLPSSHAGRVARILVKAGDSVPIGATVVVLEAGSSAPAPAAAPAAARPAAAAPATPRPETPAAAPAAPAKPAPAAAPAPAPVPAAPAASSPAPASPAAARPAVPVANPPAAAAAPASDAGGAVAAGPAVRRFAREVGVDLQRVSGSGEGGRITREDVLEAVRQANLVIRNGAVTAPARTAVAASPTTTTPTVVEGAAADAWGPIRVEKLTKIRKTIAAKMHESWSTVPRVTNMDDADVTELERIRQTSKEDYAARGIKLTTLPFVIKSVAMALRNNPVINASIDLENGSIIYKDYVHIGIAVDADRGLVVPSLRNADQLSIPEIARQLASLADKVRDNQFTIDDLRGSTFTISNLGAVGGTYATPIVNTPEVAILLLGRARKLPVVVNDAIVPRLMLPLSLSYDHRLVDGAAAARFLNDVISYLKAPSRLLLAP
ncbi:MAG: 2-oxo acid dehydrogenase subunit E2 [Pirellulales bacterium]